MNLFKAYLIHILIVLGLCLPENAHPAGLTRKWAKVALDAVDTCLSIVVHLGRVILTDPNKPAPRPRLEMQEPPDASWTIFLEIEEAQRLQWKALYVDKKHLRKIYRVVFKSQAEPFREFLNASNPQAQLDILISKFPLVRREFEIRGHLLIRRNREIESRASPHRRHPLSSEPLDRLEKEDASGLETIVFELSERRVDALQILRMLFELDADGVMKAPPSIPALKKLQMIRSLNAMNIRGAQLRAAFEASGLEISRLRDRLLNSDQLLAEEVNERMHAGYPHQAQSPQAPEAMD